MTSSQVEQSLLFENSLINTKDLNETQFSQITKGSGEKDFKELASLIFKEVREDKGNLSILSLSKNADKSNSIISNEEIWNTNQSADDSKNFIKNFQDIDQKKKMATLIKNKNKILMTKKPIHLNIKSQLKEEDYNDEIDESIDSKKTEQIFQLGTLETKNNNLNELSIPNPNEVYDSKNKLYTDPIDYHKYRTSYSYSNFSFTTQSQLSLNAKSIREPSNYHPRFPTIPEHHRAIQSSSSLEENLFLNKEREANSLDRDFVNFNNKAAIENNEKEQKDKKLVRKINSTSHSTESNESAKETNVNNNMHSTRKFYTPTHQSSNLPQHYNLSQLQRELNFSNQMNSNKFNIPTNNMIGTQNLPNFNNLNSCNVMGNNISMFSPTSMLNSNMNNIKSISFCSNIKSPTAIPYYNVEYKSRPIIPSNAFSPEQKFNQKSEEQPVDFKIKLEDIIIGKEKRTTLMLRNIPNKYTLQNIINEINPNFAGKYDYINLPIDYERKLNLGYAFINFVDPMHIVMFYETYHNKKWSKYRSDKKIDLNYAEKQGKKDMSCKDDNTYFAQEDKKINFKKIVPKLEIPTKFYDFFKKIYPNSVCIVENKIGITGDKTFYIKCLGKR